MNKKRPSLIFFGLLLISTASCNASNQEAHTVSITQGNNAMISSNSSAASFNGKNARISVNGDTIQAKDGALTVNGISYGTVTETSIVKYTVQGNEKILTVDGVVRKPVR